MAPALLELEGTNLGEKHRNYNKLVKQAIASKTAVEPGDLNSGANDVEHLMKIDIASNNRDVEYILNVLKCEDMLYVSRAINQSTWLITEQRYAHIINPTYLNTHIFPEMTANAKTKFMKHIRHNLKDEAQAELFFEHEIQISVKGAVKWLPNCSKEFIAPRAHYLLKSSNHRLFKRVCEKSPDVVQVLLQEKAMYMDDKLKAANFLLHVDPEKYLDVVEKQNEYYFPKFGARTTKLLMQKCPNRIINNFDKYCRNINVPIFVQHLKKDEIKDFLFSEVKKIKRDSGLYENLEYFLYEPKNVKYFMDAMTAEQRSQFIDQVFINKVHTKEDLKEDSEKYGMRKFFLVVTSRNPEYIYYEFETAFDKITKDIRSSTSQEDKKTLLELLIKCTPCDSQSIHTVLKYYHEKHTKDTLKSKVDFLKKLLPKIQTFKLNSESWDILDDMFKQMDIYNAASENYVADCEETIVLYKVIHGEKVPEEIEKKIMEKYSMRKNNNMFQSHQNSLTDEEKGKVFKYLYDRIIHKIQNNKMTNETEFKKGLGDIQLVLTVLDKWKKDLSDYPWVLDKIREYLKMRKDNSWKTSMASIYNIKKSWKRLMFEESIELCPSESVCLNVLKHNNQLLSLERDEVNALCRNNKISLQRLLNKLRVYWPKTLAVEWTQRYLDALNQQEQEGHKAVVSGICALLPRHQLMELVHHYAPKQDKIDHSESDDIPLDIQRQLAKSMLVARPRPPPDAILLYAKGDYLQYALPSLLAIFNNANATQTRNFITKLLSAPVSLQKHGVRIVFDKFPPKEALTIFHDIWKSTTNATIRAVVFKFTFSLLSKDKTPQKDVWEILFFFIGNLSHEEDKTIYEIISKDENFYLVPNNLKARYLMRIYRFFTGLIPKLPDKDKEHYQWKLSNLMKHTTESMECFPTEFILEILVKFVEDSFFKEQISDGTLWQTALILTAFLFCSNGDKTQIERYNLFLLPILQRCIKSWDLMDDKGNYFIRYNVDKLLYRLKYDLKEYVCKQEMDIPLTIFEDIQKQLNQLSVPDNYIMLTKWKLTVELTRVLKRRGFVNKNWNETCVNLAPEFGMKCLKHLKSDVTFYFPCIYLLFSKALKDMLENIMPDKAKLIIYQSILSDVQFVQAYLSVVKMYPRYLEDNSQALKEQSKNLCKLMREHPSMEVKMHYNHRFKLED